MVFRGRYLMKRIFLLLCGLTLSVVLGAGGGTPVAAQGVASLFSAGGQKAETAETRIDNIMRQAAEHGVGVVVIDNNGQIITTSSSLSEPETDVPTVQPEPQDSAPLRHMQDKALNFRAALLDRVLQLPNAFAEVAYILRAASPDGTIFAFVKAMLISLALFGVGVIVERQI